MIVLEPFKPDKRLEPLLATRVEGLLKRTFFSRRKMLRNTLSGLRSSKELESITNEAGISLQQRPQEISPAAWLELARRLDPFDHSGKDL